MIKTGIIHISSNSLKLTIAEIEEIGYFKIVDELYTPISICYSFDKKAQVCSGKLNYIISTIDTYESLCLASKTENIIVIANNSFNQIENNNVITNYLKNKFNLDLKILTLEEELHYTYLGVTKNLNLENSLLIDVTGTSTHLIWIKDYIVQKSITLPFGSINLTYKFDLNSTVLGDSVDACLNYINEKINSIDWIKNSFDSIVLVGDIGKNVANIDRKKRRHILANINNYEISQFDFHEIFNTVKSKNLKQRRKIEGINPDIANVIFVPLNIINSILSLNSVELIQISNSSLREGVLCEYIDNNYDSISNVLDYSIYGILHSLNCNISHAEQVYWITLKLFEDLKELHHIDDSFLNILKTGSMLHDCGVSINYHHHHKHSFYIILNSDINELNNKELLMSAAIAASHRFNNYQIPLSQYSSLINKLDLKIISQIGALLKIAEGLDRTLMSVVKDLIATFDDTEVTIEVSSESNLDVEIQQALRASESFKEAFNRTLNIKKK